MVKFAELANQNPWWKYGKDFQRFDKDLAALHDQRIPIERKSVQLQLGDAGVIRGCRQIGKTTYLKTLVSRLINEDVESRRIMYLSVDQLIGTRRELRSALDIFLTRNMDAEEVYIILDEITALRDWNLELKTLSDSGTMQKARLLVTGSSGEALRNTGEQMPGRGLEGNEYYMKPLSFREFTLQTIDAFTGRARSNELVQALIGLKKILQATKLMVEEDTDKLAERSNMVLPFQEELTYLFGHYLRCGGFPVSINSYFKPTAEEKEWLIEPKVAETFVRTTLGELSKYGKSEATARQLLSEIITRYGAMYSFTGMSDTVNHVTTTDYLDFLEKSFILHILYAIDLNKKTPKYKGKKKVYFLDPFIYYSIKSSLTGTDVNETISETIDNEIMLSEIVEGTVVSHLAMSRETPYLKEKDTFTWFYYDNSGREIDNVVKIDGGYRGIEVKYRNNVGLGDVTRAQGIDDYIVLSRDDYDVNGNTCVIPACVYLSILERSEHNL